MYRDWSIRSLHKSNFGRLYNRGRGQYHSRKYVFGNRQPTNGIVRTELEFQPVRFIAIQRIIVQDFNIHLPFLKVSGRSHRDAWWQVTVDLVANLVGEHEWGKEERGILSSTPAAQYQQIKPYLWLDVKGSNTLFKRFVAIMAGV